MTKEQQNDVVYYIGYAYHKIYHHYVCSSRKACGDRLDLQKIKKKGKN